MKSIEEIYPAYAKEYEETDYFYGSSDYDPMLKSYGYEILIKVDDEDYQGDSRILYKNEEKIGLLIFGWGSCSGCDALQNCSTIKELEDLQKELHEQIKWFENKQEALDYFKTHDWEGDYSWHANETKEFVEKCLKLLN